MDMTYHLITKTKIIDCKHFICKNRRWAKNLQSHHKIKFKSIESMKRRKRAHHSFASIFANKHNANKMVLSWGRLNLLYSKLQVLEWHVTKVRYGDIGLKNQLNFL